MYRLFLKKDKFECQKLIYILRPNLGQLRKMQLQGLRLGIEPAPPEL